MISTNDQVPLNLAGGPSTDAEIDENCVLHRATIKCHDNRFHSTPASEVSGSSNLHESSSSTEHASLLNECNNYHCPPANSLRPTSNDFVENTAVDESHNGKTTPVSWWTGVKRLSQSSLDYLQLSWRNSGEICREMLDHMQDSWFLEIASCILALLLLGTEIGILAWFDDTAVDTWKLEEYPLNSAVALITTSINASLLLAARSCLGQTKWLWFTLDQSKTFLQRLIWVDSISRSIVHPLVHF